MADETEVNPTGEEGEGNPPADPPTDPPEGEGDPPKDPPEGEGEGGEGDPPKDPPQLPIDEHGQGEGEGEGEGEGKEKPPEETADQKEWRDRLAGNNSKARNYLKKFASEADFMNSALHAQDLIAKGQHKAPPKLSDNPTAKELAEYRKATGIPEEAKDYKITLPKNFQMNDGERELLDNFKEAMHAKHVNPEIVQATFDWWLGFRESEEAVREGFAKQDARTNRSELEGEWGTDYDSNVKAIQAYAIDRLGEEGMVELMNLRLADGSFLGAKAPFLRLLAQPAKDWAGPDLIHTGDVDATAKSLQEQMDDLIALQYTDEAKFLTKEHQDKIAAVAEKLDRLSERK